MSSLRQSDLPRLDLFESNLRESDLPQLGLHHSGLHKPELYLPDLHKPGLPLVGLCSHLLAQPQTKPPALAARHGPVLYRQHECLLGLLVVPKEKLIYLMVISHSPVGLDNDRVDNSGYRARIYLVDRLYPLLG